MKKTRKYFLIAIVLLVSASPAFATEVAITVDDLPFTGSLPPKSSYQKVAKEMLAGFKKHHVTGVYGFINGDKTVEPSPGMGILQAWVKNDQLLGNHTYSHMNMMLVTLSQYMENIQKNDPILSKLMGTKNYRYFRYTFLYEGFPEKKREIIRQYLFKNHYTIAPVTIDFADYQWNEPYIRCLKKQNKEAIAWLEKTYLQQAGYALERSQNLSQHLFNRDAKQILLLHIKPFDAMMIDQLLTKYEQAGVKFISLQVALNDSIYKIDPPATIKSYTFLNQIKVGRNLKITQDPKKTYSLALDRELNSICR